MFQMLEVCSPVVSSTSHPEMKVMIMMMILMMMMIMMMIMKGMRGGAGYMRTQGDNIQVSCH